MDSWQVNFKLIEGGKPPARAHDGDAGWDLTARESVITLTPGFISIRTGVCIEPDPRVWFMLAPRSSMFIRKGLIMVPAVIDSGYRGELFATFYAPNHPDRDGSAVSVEKGHRICQLVPFLHQSVHWQSSIELGDSSRGENGYGSTGE